MTALGLHLALTDDELSVLSSVEDDKKFFHVQELEESKFGTADACQTDTAWAYIHSAFNGSDPDGPLTPVSARPAAGSFFRRFFGRSTDAGDDAGCDERMAIVGSHKLLDTGEHYVGLVPAGDVPSVASALEGISTVELQRRVRDAHTRFKASGSVDDAADYAGSWYPGLVNFFRQAADSGRNVVFMVDF